MSFLRVTNPSGVATVDIDDLGITIAVSASDVVLSDYFSVNDLYLSADLESLIIASTLTVELDYGTGWTSVAAGDYTNRDTLGTFLNVYEITNDNNNEDLVDGSEVNASGSGGNPLHVHDARYYTETEIGSTASGSSGAGLVGTYAGGWTNLTGADVQTVFDNLDGLLTSLVTLDTAYDNDSDGILDVDGSTKPLIFRSDNSNDVIINRTDTSTTNEFLVADVSGDELILGSAASGALAKIDVRVATDLRVDGNITFVGTITDTTVNELNVTNADIRLRDGATTGADAQILVERGSTGTDASLLWDETADRWKAGLEGSENTIALLELNEVVTGIWEFQGGAAADPSLYLTDKAAAPTTNLGTATQIPVSSINNLLSVYDKTRTKFLGVNRQFIYFTGRDNANNNNEYARCCGTFTCNQSSARLIRNMTLIGASIQTNGAETWNMRVRKNGVVTNVYSLAATAVAGAKDQAANIDFNADDVIQVYIDGTQVDRPFITLEFAERP